MRSTQRGSARPCVSCDRPTRFEFDLRGPRGAHLRWVPICVPCGEDVKVRDQALTREQRDAA